ncbi:mCG140943 [Mus musculus]|nr:mCG140943 [Mus musculus]
MRTQAPKPGVNLDLCLLCGLWSSSSAACDFNCQPLRRKKLLPDSLLPLGAQLSDAQPLGDQHLLIRQRTNGTNFLMLFS